MSKRIQVALALVALGVSGCGVATGAPTETGEPSIDALPAITAYSDVEFPLAAFRTRPDEQLTLGRAYDRAVQGCLARYGIDYPLPERTATPNFDRPIGVISADEAARFGYKSPHAADIAATDRAKAAEKTPDAVTLGVLSGAGKSTVNGVTVPVGGCAAQAQHALAEHNPSQENRVIALVSESYTRAEADSRVVAAFGRWRTCMNAAGFDYRDPWAANNDPAFGTGEPTAQEIATARADVACRVRENVTGTWLAVIIAYQKRLVSQHQSDLDRYRSETETQLKAAAPLLGR
ncbi:MAG TPA: hypothetical protein VGL02_03030 [Streptomyces sp.]